MVIVMKPCLLIHPVVIFLEATWQRLSEVKNSPRERAPVRDLRIKSRAFQLPDDASPTGLRRPFWKRTLIFLKLIFDTTRDFNQRGIATGVWQERRRADRVREQSKFAKSRYWRESKEPPGFAPVTASLQI
ncbi:MAG: hypothetical protein WAV27_14495 [Xanthobacteraceae bacterium]|jgi:hypothetical protein